MSDQKLPAVTRARQAIADAIHDQIGIAAHRGQPGQVRAGTAFVRPTPGKPYVDLLEGTYEEPVVNLSIVFVAGLGDYQAALDWIDEKIAECWTMFESDPHLGGASHTYMVIEDVSSPGFIDGDKLSVRADLSAMHITPTEAS